MDKFNLDGMMEFGDQFVLKRIADVPETQINLVTLPPGQALPAHNANSNVRLLPLKGEIAVTIHGAKNKLGVHEMASVTVGTPMQISNESASHAAFLVIKTPNPSEIG